jgi:tetratricopeptide (TPR) repeat protein
VKVASSIPRSKFNKQGEGKMTSFKLFRAHLANKTLPEVRTTCAECRSDISADAKFCPHCHAPIVRRYCPGCSKLVPENTEACPYCGTSAKARFRQSGNVPTIVAIGVLLILLTSLMFRSSAPPVDQSTSLLPEIYQPNVEVRQAVLTQPEPHAAPEVQLASAAPAEDGASLNLLGHQLIKTGRYAEAIPVLKRAVACYAPSSADVSYKFALYNLGHALRHTGNPTEAISYLERAIAIDGTWTKAQNELAVARAEVEARSAQLQVGQ